jgi:hypothetical protein
MIEAQQQFLGDSDLLDKKPAILKTDGAAIKARRHLAKLMRAKMTGISTLAETARPRDTALRQI